MSLRLLPNACLVLAITWSGLAHGQQSPPDPHLSDALQPHHSLTPRQVVEIQLEALKRNGEGDKGIEVVFRFASPANRMQTGPLERFKRMIKGGAYALMLNFESVVYDEPEVAGDMARQRVVLVSREQTLGYYFMLSRQMEPPFKDCWMTEMVGVVPIGGTMAQPALPKRNEATGREVAMRADEAVSASGSAAGQINH